jgi:hypothetical protein
MKIKDIVMREDGTSTVQAVSGNKVVLKTPAGEIDTTADSLVPDANKPGSMTLKPTDPNSIKPGMPVNTGDGSTSEEIEDDEDLAANGNQDVGNDGTDKFIRDVVDAEYEQANGYGEEETDEGMFGLGNKTAEEWAKTSPQMAQLLQFRAKYQGTSYSEQIEKRIQLLKDRLDLDAGEVAGPGGAPKPVVPPEMFNANQLREADDDLLDKMRAIAGLR